MLDSLPFDHFHTRESEKMIGLHHIQQLRDHIHQIAQIALRKHSISTPFPHVIRPLSRVNIIHHNVQIADHIA